MAKPLDETDRALIRALERDARISNKDLAASVGLSPSGCIERVRSLQERGVVTGFHAEVDPQHLGVGLQALIAVRLTKHTRADVDSFREHVLALPEVLSMFHVTGSEDFLIHVAAKDPDHLRDLALDRFTTRPEVLHIETSLVFEHVQRFEWPQYVTSTQ